MSSTVTVAEYAAVVVDNYCEVAAAALIIYESIIVTGQEARYFWTERLTGAAVLFYLNKYLTLLSFIYTMCGFVTGISNKSTYASESLDANDRSCTAIVQSTYVIEMLVYLPWAAFSGLRALALSRKWPLAVFIFCVSLVPIGVHWANFWYGEYGVTVSLLGCVSDQHTPVSVTKKFTIASRVSLIVADCLLIVITWFSVSSPRHVQMRKNTFATVLLRDGLIYFLSLLMLNSLHLILTMLSESNIPSLQDASFVSLFAEPLTTILVSRFLLHLQSAKHKSTGVDTALGTTSSSSSARSRSTSIVFERVIGSLDQALSVHDFLGPVDTITGAPKDSSKEHAARGDGDPDGGDCESPMSKVGYDVFELPVRSPSIGNEEA